MSCILTSEKHINSIVHFMLKHHGIKTFATVSLTDKTLEDFRTILFSVNLRAYLERYSHRNDIYEASYNPHNRDYVELENEFAFIKLCHCYLYQVSDLTKCSDRELVEHILEQAIKAVIETHELYDKAPYMI